VSRRLQSGIFQNSSGFSPKWTADFVGGAVISSPSGHPFGGEGDGRRARPRQEGNRGGSQGRRTVFLAMAAGTAGRRAVDRQKLFLSDFKGLARLAAGGAENGVRFPEIRLRIGINSSGGAKIAPH
jgi:hypothetical protein